MAEIIHRPSISEQTRLLELPTRNGRDQQFGNETVVTDSRLVNASLESVEAPRPRNEYEGRLERLQSQLAAETERHAAAVERAEQAEQRVVELEGTVDGEFERAQREGLAQGMDEGRETGRGEARAEVAEQVRSLLSVARNAQKEFAQSLTQAVEDGVVEVIFASVVKILGERAVGIDVVADIARQLTKEIIEGQKMRVCVSPTDYELIKKASARARKGRLPLQAEFVPDDRVELGGCIVETANGEIDGRLETQLERLKDILLEVRRTRPATTESTA